MALKQIISSEIKRLHPNIKSYLADRYANKYVSCVLDEIKQAILRPINENNELSFSSTSAYNKCGKTDTKNSLWNLLQTNPHTRLVDIVFAGQKGKLARVKLNPIYEEKIMYELLAMPTQALTDQERQEIRERANRVIEIDPTSLSKFIEQTHLAIQHSSPGTPYWNKLTENLIRARELFLEQQEVNGKYYLMEYWEEVDTGREYGHYNSLQRMTKEIRHAALGVCHKYDFQAHSFAVMASMAREIDPAIQIAQIEDYIRYRTSIRQRIARDVGVPEENIKQVFTSLGFGAKPINNPFNAIRKQVYNQQAYDKLINQTEFKFIIDDLAKINDVIDQEFPNEDFEGLLGKTYSHKSATGRRKSRSQKLAWIYQNSEAYITRRFIDIVRDLTKLEPLMSVHDCVYYKQKLPLSTLQDAQVILREEYSLIKIEHEAIYPITTDDNFESRFDEFGQEEMEHAERMRLEEQRARGYQSTAIDHETKIYDPRTRIIDRQKHQELPDYDEYQYEYELPNYK